MPPTLSTIVALVKVVWLAGFAPGKRLAIEVQAKFVNPPVVVHDFLLPFSKST
jgi:hypothetical protein